MLHVLHVLHVLLLYFGWAIYTYCFGVRMSALSTGIVSKLILLPVSFYGRHGRHIPYCEWRIVALLHILDLLLHICLFSLVVDLSQFSFQRLYFLSQSFILLLSNRDTFDAGFKAFHFSKSLSISCLIFFISPSTFSPCSSMPAPPVFTSLSLFLLWLEVLVFLPLSLSSTSCALLPLLDVLPRCWLLRSL